MPSGPAVSKYFGLGAPASPRLASLAGPLLSRWARAVAFCQGFGRRANARAHAAGGDAPLHESYASTAPRRGLPLHTST